MRYLIALALALGGPSAFGAEPQNCRYIGRDGETMEHIILESGCIPAFRPVDLNFFDHNPSSIGLAITPRTEGEMKCGRLLTSNPPQLPEECK